MDRYASKVLGEGVVEGVGYSETVTGKPPSFFAKEDLSFFLSNRMADNEQGNGWPVLRIVLSASRASRMELKVGRSISLDFFSWETTCQSDLNSFIALRERDDLLVVNAAMAVDLVPQLEGEQLEEGHRSCVARKGVWAMIEDRRSRLSNQLISVVRIRY